MWTYTGMTTVFVKRNPPLIQNWGFMTPQGQGGLTVDMVNFFPPSFGRSPKNCELMVGFFWQRLYVNIRLVDGQFSIETATHSLSHDPLHQVRAKIVMTHKNEMCAMNCMIIHSQKQLAEWTIDIMAQFYVCWLSVWLRCDFSAADVQSNTHKPCTVLKQPTEMYRNNRNNRFLFNVLVSNSTTLVMQCMVDLAA